MLLRFFPWISLVDHLDSSLRSHELVYLVAMILL